MALDLLAGMIALNGFHAILPAMTSTGSSLVAVISRAFRMKMVKEMAAAVLSQVSMLAMQNMQRSLLVKRETMTEMDGVI